MSQINIEELKAQATRHRQSGDSFRSIGHYLGSTNASEAEISAIINHVNQLEKANKLNPTPHRKGVSFMSGMIGCVLITLGGILAYVLWGEGWISSVPILMIGAGLFGLSGAMD